MCRKKEDDDLDYEPFAPLDGPWMIAFGVPGCRWYVGPFDDWEYLRKWCRENATEDPAFTTELVRPEDYPGAKIVLAPDPDDQQGGFRFD